MKTIKMSEIARNIDRVKQKSGKTWTEILHTIGWERSTLTRILKSQRHPRIDTLLKLAEGIGCDIVEFFGYEKAPRPIIEVKADDHFVNVPLLADPASLGSGLEIDETKRLEEPCLIHKRVLRKGGKYYAVFVKGDSMSPVLNDGDIVAVDIAERDPRKLNGKLIACHTGDYEVSVKLLAVYKDRFYFKALNPKWEQENPPLVAPKKDGLVLGKVVWAWKKFE